MNYSRYIRREFLHEECWILRLCLVCKLIRIVKTSSQVLRRVTREDAELRLPVPAFLLEELG